MHWTLKDVQGLTISQYNWIIEEIKRQKKRELAKALKEKDIHQPDIIADLLAYLDIYQMDDTLWKYINLPDALKVIRSIRNFISLLKNTNTINIAVEKASKSR